MTGASGFVGGRLVERLASECRATVRVLVRTVARAAPLSRYPLEIAVGDVRDASALTAAAADCDVIVHCAKATEGRPSERLAVDVEGARNVLEAALRGRVSRVVHVSTVAVYDLPPEGDVDETTPRRRGRSDLYADAKRDAEEAVLEYASRVPVAIVQPTVVYGPRAGVYGREIVEELKTTRIPLVDGGRGICNAVYIDDLVTALLLAVTSEQAPGEVFLVSGPEHPTWADFFGAFEHMLGVQRTVPMSSDAALALWTAQRRRRWLVPELLRVVRQDSRLRSRLLDTHEGFVLRRVAERVLPTAYFAPERWPEGGDRAEERLPAPPLVAFRPDVVRFLASRARVHSRKARELLGYQPVFGFAEGMALTKDWARWEGLLDGASP